MFIRTGAEADLASAPDWYERQKSGLGDELLEEIARALAELESDPHRSRLYYRNFHRVLLRRFPYKIFYQVIGDRIVVFRVLHAKQAHGERLS